MAGLVLEISGLEELKKNFSSERISKSVAFAVNNAILPLHQALEFEIVKDYTFPSNKRLSKVLRPKSSSSVKQGTNFIEQSLEYESKPIRLAEFALKTSIVPVKARFMMLNGKGKFVYKKKRTAEAVQVMVKKSNGYKTVVGNGNGGFLQKRDLSGKDKWTGYSKPIRKTNNIYQRLEDRTWIIEPIARTPIEALYGPSLSFVARSIFNRNSSKYNEMVTNNIREALGKLL
jgi:hypothetical protein